MGLRKVFADFPVPREASTGLPVGGLAGLEEHYRDLSKRYGYTLAASEADINDLGYKYLYAKPPDLASAISTLKHNTELFPDSPNAFDSLSDAYFRSRQGEAGIASGEKAVALAREQKDSRLERLESDLTYYWLGVASLKAWFGQDAELASTARHAVEHAAGSTDPVVLERTGQMALLASKADKEQAKAGLNLIRRAVELGKDHRFLPYFQLSLGVAEYRNGNYAAADQALSGATLAGDTNYDVLCASAFYEAMSQFRQGKETEARALLQEAISMMPPLPADPKDPLAGNHTQNDLGPWMAYKEAITLLKMEGPGELEFKRRRDALEDARGLIRKAIEEFASGLSRDATAHLAAASADVPNNTELSLLVAALQAWFGEDAELAATVRRTTEFANGTSYPVTAERAAKSGLIRPSADKAQLEASLALARRAVELGKNDRDGLPWFQMALGMAEYRSGNYPAADDALREAVQISNDNRYVRLTASFYRAMSLFRQGKENESRALFTQTASTMKPLPIDEENPLGGNLMNDDLVAWMAYKEAKSLLKI